MERKKCYKCGQELPITEFNWADKKSGKRQGMCRKCFSEYNKVRYASNPDKFKSAVKSYRESNPEKVLETRLATNAKNPNKQNARRCVEAAIAAGVLTRPDHCYGCGCSAAEHRIEAHHHDYNKPLEIIWLCTPCHRQMDCARRGQAGEKPDPVAKSVVCIDTGIEYPSIADAAKAVGVRASRISECLSDCSKKARGYHWRYA